MCGICGQWDPNGVRLEDLQHMAHQIRHRGPDDEGFYINGAVGLGSRRLSIVDLNTGNQPITNEDETLWIVFNGEIYNYPALRAELVKLGHVFRTQTDTEVILHLYEEYGPSCVKKLRGMFAFALWDVSAKRLFLARDPLGQKPLYYTLRNYHFAFASEIKALLEDNPAAPKMNVRAMHHLISLRTVPGTETLFEGVYKLPPGHSLTFHNGSLQTDCYWDLRYHPKNNGAPDDVIEQLRELLHTTVESHLISDVPVGAFLSGGIDSSVITALMAGLQPRTSTFSIGVREDDFNELPYSRAVAQRYQTDHYENIVEPHLVATLPQMMWHMEEPVDPFAFGVYAASELASKHVKVILGGDGGDEMFAGYDRYYGNQLVDLYCLIPQPLRQRLLEPLLKQIPDDYSYNNRVQKLRWMIAMSHTTAGERYAQSASFLRFGQAHKQELYSAEMWKELGQDDSSSWLLAYFEADNAQDAIDRMLYTDVKTRLSDHLLMVNDRMTMAHSIEGRSPYVDQVVTEFAAMIPASLKINKGRLKHVLREVARHYLPKELVDRPKQGFSFPLAYWFRNELGTLSERIFAESRLASANVFRRETLFALLNEHRSGRLDHNYRLWLLLNMELWYRMFIEGATRDDLRELVTQSSAPTKQVAVNSQ